MKNKKLWVILAVVAVVAILIFAIIASLVGTYNGLVEKQAEVDQKFAQVQTVLQRRSDLIPNLVSTVKGYAAHEEEVYTAIADARAALSGAKTPEELSEANGELDSAISRLLVVVENYPDLKASANFTALQDELAGAENRISTERGRYNDAVKEYNTAIRKFPNNIFAGMFGFTAADYFEADEGAQKVPEVNFD